MSLGIERLTAVGDLFHNALTLVDTAQAEEPLVYVNQAFLALTGYQADEVLGRNCRFLQGPATDPEDVATIRRAIAKESAIYCDLLNYRKNGEPFFNRLVLLPITLGGRSHFFGMQIDATHLYETGKTRNQSFEAWKTSETIRDLINTPLMMIFMALDTVDDSHQRRQILERAFDRIINAVRAIGNKI